MTIDEFYVSINGNYKEIKGRLSTEERIKRFLLKFLEIDDMDVLKNAWENDDYQNLFTYSNRIKGIALNLSFDSLADSTSKLIELSKTGTLKDKKSASEIYERCCQEYDLIEKNIRKIS